MTKHLICISLFLVAAPMLAAAPMLNAVEHGADPTGRRDSTAVLTQLHATGKKVYYPNGVYRFNGKTLDLSGGVVFESVAGVTVRNDVSPANIIQFDDFGNLVGLMHNHLEVDERRLGGPLPMDNGSLVRPPLSTAQHKTKVDFLAHWYNDFGLEHRRANPGWGWIGWYYWTWNHHDATGDGYAPARHPLLGFYRGDDAIVLDWQCYWLKEYGATGVILFMPSRWKDPKLGGIEGWETPAHRNYWIYRLFTDTPNFRKLKYVLTAPTPYSKSTPETRQWVEREWRALVEKLYLRYDNFYAVRRGGKQYPMLYLHEEAGLRGVFDNYRGGKGTAAFYRRMAALFQSHGFGGVALLARHPISGKAIDFSALERDGVLHFTGSYSGDNSTGATYAERVARYSPPVGPTTVLNVCTAKQTHTPHPSKWRCPGHSPKLFQKMLAQAVAHALRHHMPRIITCYNVAEWAEGGPGLQPNMQDRFGYLEAVRDAIVIRAGDAR